MATTGDGVTTSYQSGGGGKFEKRPIRRRIGPYDRPPKRSLFAKLVEPASALLYAGADRLFALFRNRLLPGTSEEPRNGFQDSGPTSVSNNGTGVPEPSTDEGAKMASISEATEISELEFMLKQKTFTRSEIERLTTLLHSRTTETDVEGDSAKLPIRTSQVLRLEESTSDMLNEHAKDRETRNFSVPTSTPTINSRSFEDDVATPAELAKAYMGTRQAKLSPLSMRPSSQPLRQDPLLLNNTTILPKTPVTSLVPKTTATFKTFENGLTTPGSQGRSALHNKARSPYYRGPSTLSQKGAASPSAWEHERSIGSSRTGAKRRNSVIDDIGYGGPMRRIRQKANLLSRQSPLSKHTSEFGSSQKPLLRNEPEPKPSMPLEQNLETSKLNLGYGSVPTQASKMALKIFEHLDRMSPKKKPSESRISGITEKIDSPKNLSSSRDDKKSEGQHRVWLPNASESTSQINNVLHSMNGNCTEKVRGKTPIVTNTSPVQTPTLPEVEKISRLQESSVVNNQKMDFNFPATSIQKEPTASQRSGKSINIVGPSGVKSSVSPDAKSFGSTSFTNTNGTLASSSSSFQSSGSHTIKLVSSTTSTFLPSTTTTATSSTSSAFPSSVPAPIFSSGSASVSSPSASVAQTKPFASTSFATSSNGGNTFAFSSPSATLTTNGFQATTQAASTAVRQAVPFKCESGISGIPSTSSSSLFNSSAPSCGLSSAVATSSTTSISGCGSTSGSAANMFAPTALQPPPSSTFGCSKSMFSARSDRRVLKVKRQNRRK